MTGLIVLPTIPWCNKVPGRSNLRKGLTFGSQLTGRKSTEACAEAVVTPAYDSGTMRQLPHILKEAEESQAGTRVDL